jgi:hypothetical protein
MEVDDGFDTAEALKLIEEDILASVFVLCWVILKNASSGVCVAWLYRLLHQMAQTFFVESRYLFFDLVVHGESCCG